MPQIQFDFGSVLPFIRSAVVILALLAFFSFVIRKLEHLLLRNVRSKSQIHNIKVFSTIIKYASFIAIMLLAILSYHGDLTGFGLGVGFLTAALGWALQRPITGIAAWLMIIVYRPFRIGDRIVVGGVKGDVADIKLTHIYIAEIGGIVPSEENSKRVILVPNSILFDQNITNYTGESNYNLDQVSFTITFDSDLAKAKEIAMSVARSVTKDVIQATGQEPYVRSFFSAAGIAVNIRYMSPAVRLQEVSSEMTERIIEEMRKHRSVELSYNISKVILRREEDAHAGRNQMLQDFDSRVRMSP